MACVSKKTVNSVHHAFNSKPALLSSILIPTRAMTYARGNVIAHAKDWREKENSEYLLPPAVCPVPRDQQPMYELKMLQESFLADWATMPLPDFLLRLAGVYVGFTVTLGLPVSAVTFDLNTEPLQCVIAASIGSTFLVTVLMWRLYLGWDHVGNRLLSATVEYEETGWYDGQVWVKSPAVLTRERLLGAYTVRPAVNRLKRTLLGLGGALAASVVALAISPPPSVYSAPENYVPAPPSSSSSSSFEQTDYLERVRMYEPWALETEDSSPPSMSVMSHMEVQ